MMPLESKNVIIIFFDWFPRFLPFATLTFGFWIVPEPVLTNALATLILVGSQELGTNSAHTFVMANKLSDKISRTVLLLVPVTSVMCLIELRRSSFNASSTFYGEVAVRTSTGRPER